MKTRAGSVYNTCYHENLSGYCIQHLLPRKLERVVYTTLATTKTWTGSVYNTCERVNLSGKCIQHLRTWKLELEVCTTHATVAIRNPERHVRKASHRGSKQQWRSPDEITLLLLVRTTHIYFCSSRTSRSWWITQSTQRHRRGCNNIPSVAVPF